MVVFRVFVAGIRGDGKTPRHAFRRMADRSDGDVAAMDLVVAA